MLSVGENIQNNSDSLQKIPVRYLYDAIRNPRLEIAAKIRQLRIVRNLDKKQYSDLKRQLPYCVCAMFNPAFRRTENFAYTEYFMVDIDHLSEKEISVASAKQRIVADSRVVLCFVSPSEDGLKVLFRLKERCYDAGLYSLFYKIFVHNFAQQYNFQQVIDAKTCDVTRACFISVDADAYFNAEATPVDLTAYVDVNNPQELFAQKADIEHWEAENKPQETPPDEKTSHDPDAETMARIRAQLNPHVRKKLETQVEVPAILNELMADLKQYVENYGIMLTEVHNIQSAKKMNFAVGMKQAEINLFYGKRGFTVVQSPRTGTNPELNALVADVILSFLAERT
ncbi:MAG: CRISPR-associated primase-polymerase type B [Paludibacteraceae bacterium]